MKRLLATVAIAAGISTTAAEAVTVSPASTAVFSFDVSSYGELSFDLSMYSCPVECAGNGNPLQLAQGASFTVNFGTSAGASDIAPNTFTNPFSTDINNVSGHVVTSPSVMVAPGLDTLYATFVHVDDVFGVENFFLSDSGEGVLLQGSVLPIPLPATLPLLLSGLGGMAALGRRRRA